MFVTGLHMEYEMILRLATSVFILIFSSACTAEEQSSGPIIHDGEYYFLAA
jgi:hypothetical protein